MTEDYEMRFRYYKPDEEKGKKHAEIREKCRELAEYLAGELPYSRELNITINKVEEVMFWANACLARSK